MREIEINNWQDLWKVFYDLVILLENEKQTTIIDELKKSQRFVNGHKDGWFEFKNAFEESIESNRQHLTEEQAFLSDFITSTLNSMLMNRP